MSIITFSGSSLLTAGSYLSLGGISSGTVPFIVAQPMMIKSISGAANGVQLSTSFSIIINGTTTLSVPFENQQFIYQNYINIPLNILDQISIQVSGISVTSSFLLSIFLQDLI